ncbi:MAG: hypothetical protein RR317_00735 [Bilophila sp.]
MAQKKVSERRVRKKPNPATDDWLSLILTVPPSEQMVQYSYTVELYDLMPKYAWSGQTSKDGRLPNIKRTFEHLNSCFEVTITPARIESEEGISEDRHPGKTEELIEDILRKFVAEGRGIAKGGRLGVKFTLYEVAQELKRVGHARSIEEIKTALRIMAACSIRLIGRRADGSKIDMTNPLLGPLYLATREDWAAVGKAEQCYVEFHPLVESGAAKGQIRLVSYETCMRYRSVLAKYIHKRMSHNFKQARTEFAYTMGVTKLVLEAGMTPRQYPTKTMSQIVAKALDEMIACGVVARYASEPRIDPTTGKTLDVLVSIYPTQTFVEDVKAANFWQQAVRERINQRQLDEEIPPEEIE